MSRLYIGYKYGRFYHTSSKEYADKYFIRGYMAVNGYDLRASGSSAVRFTLAKLKTIKEVLMGSSKPIKGPKKLYSKFG